jgi:integrase
MAGKVEKEGRIIPRGDNAWLVRIYVGRDPKNNKRKYRSKYVNGSEADAKRALTKLLRERDTQTLTEPNTYTLNQWLDRWLKSIESNERVRANTFIEYEGSLRRYIRPSLGSRRLDKLTPLEIESVVTTLRERKLSARTVRAALIILTAALDQAVKLRLLMVNPASVVDRPKPQRKEMTAMTPQQVKRFLDATGMDRWGIVFVFALSTGMRPSEILGLQWKDIDPVEGIIRVQRTLTRKKGGRHITPPKTNQSRRTIPLPPSMARQLREHKAHQNRERLAAGEEYKNQDFVFAGPHGQPLCDRTLNDHHFKHILRQAELPLTFRLYDLRHTCATLLLLQNENPKVVSERLGHSTIVLTMDTYSHVQPSMQRGAADKLETMLFGNGLDGGAW